MVPSQLCSNTTGSNVFVGNQIIVVDFRQWYRYGYEIILYGYVMPVWSVINFAVYIAIATRQTCVVEVIPLLRKTTIIKK
jgi:hypothetical protein